MSKSGDVDFLDLVMLQKRGFLKEIPRSQSQENNGILDFTNNSAPSAQSPFASPEPSSAPSQQAEPSALSLFDAITQQTPTEASTNQTEQTYPQTPSLGSSNNEAELSAMKIQIENLEFKLEQLMQKLEQFESK